jgi:hypothetical protein
LKKLTDTKIQSSESFSIRHTRLLNQFEFLIIIGRRHLALARLLESSALFITSGVMTTFLPMLQVALLAAFTAASSFPASLLIKGNNVLIVFSCLDSVLHLEFLGCVGDAPRTMALPMRQTVVLSLEALNNGWCFSMCQSEL